MRITLFGASGLLGQELVRELAHDELTALSSKRVLIGSFSLPPTRMWMDANPIAIWRLR